MKKGWMIHLFVVFLAAFLLESCSTKTKPVGKTSTRTPSSKYPTATIRKAPTSTPTRIPTPTPALAALKTNAIALCSKGFSLPVKEEHPLPPLMFLSMNTYDENNPVEWNYPGLLGAVYDPLEARSPENVQTLACIKQFRELVAYYTDRKPGYRIIWEVRLVRKQDGQPIASTILNGGDPPYAKHIERKEAYGQSPHMAFYEWLDETFSDNFIFEHERAADSFAFTSDGKYMAVIGEDYFTAVWDVVDHKKIFERAGKAIISPAKLALSFSPDQSRLALGIPGGFEILSVDGWKSLFQIMDGEVSSIAFTADGSHIVVGFASAPGGIRVYSFENGNLVKDFGLISPISQILLSKNDEFLIALVEPCPSCSGNPESGILIWNFETGRLLNKIRRDGAKAMVFLRDEKSLGVAFHHSSQVAVYHLPSGSADASLTHDNLQTVQLIAAHPGGKWLASVDSIGTMVIWDQQSGVVAYKFYIKDSLYALSWTPDGKFLVLGMRGGRVELWNFE